MLVPFSFMKTVPVAPVATAATGVGETSFTANWNAFTGATYYLLDVSTSPSFSSFVLQDEFTTSTSYVVIGLTASTTYYYRVRANVGVDPDAQAFFDRVTTAGGTLSATEQTATNQLVLDMKAAGIWTKMKAVYPMVGASAAACAQNLKSSSFTGTFTSGWTFASTGVTGNGTSAYMDTNFNATLHLTNQIESHLSLYSRTQNSSKSSIDIGCYDVGLGKPFCASMYYNGVSAKFGGHKGDYPTNFISLNNTDTTGFLFSNRTTDTNLNLFQDGVKLATNTTNVSSFTYPNLNCWVGGYNRTPTSTDQYSVLECAFASIGDGLTDTQASNFYTAVQTFNQTLNRQVGAQIVSDADAQAYIDRVYTAGGTLTNTEANAVNQLTIDMKAAGIWTAMKAVYPMVGSSAAACAQNLKSSSFTGSFTSGWTFASTGATPNGTSAYMNTGLNIGTVLTQTNSHASFYSRTSTDVLGAYPTVIGAYGNISYTTAIDLHIRRPAPGDIGGGQLGSFTTSSVSYVETDARKFAILSRTSATSLKYYTTGVLRATNTVSDTTGFGSVTAYVGAGNYVTGTAQNFSKLECAFASIGDGLTDTQAADFYTCVQTFNTTLSRQV